MPKETPKIESLQDAYERATGKKVEKSKGPTYEIPWGEQVTMWYEKQETQKNGESAD